MIVKITDYAIGHLVRSVEVTMRGASLEKQEAMIDGVIDAAEILAQRPHAGQVEVWMDGRDHEYRRLVVGNFKVIYRIDGEVIHVTDIFDSRQNPKRMRG